MELRSGRIDFPSHVGSHTIPLRVTFPRPVRSVEVALAGYEVRYVGGEHEVRRVAVQLDVQPGARVDDGWEARLVATLCLQDDDGSGFTGFVDWLLFAELGRVETPVHGPIDRPNVER